MAAKDEAKAPDAPTVETAVYLPDNPPDPKPLSDREAKVLADADARRFSKREIRKLRGNPAYRCTW